jgi:hypothetical protein
MGCGIWDLPAGTPLIGGTCPAATAGQWIVSDEDRAKSARAMLPPPGQPRTAEFKVDVASSICSRCYAGKGQYPTPYAQAGEMARYFWARECAKSPEGRAEFIETMTRAVLAFAPRKPDRHGIKPFRVHSSGDFFSPAYYEMWVEIADRIATEDEAIRFWAPTRVWGMRAYDWSLLGKLRSHNMVVRPSAYHMNDAAPERLWATNARGTTAVYNAENLGMAPALERMAHPESRKIYEENRKRAGTDRRDDRLDWNCQTYAIKKDANGKESDLSTSCKNAIAPDGKLGCRACWISRNLRVCYTAH